MSTKERAYVSIVALFSTLVIISNIIAIKLTKAPFLPSAGLPTGLITYPFTFLLCDFVTEFYGEKRAQFMVFLGFILSITVSLLIKIALLLPSYDPETEHAFQKIFSMNAFIVFSSMVAFLSSQLLDISLYALIKKKWGGGNLWLRANISTLCSQALDTTLINILFLYIGLEMPLPIVFSVIAFTFFYKATLSLFLTPLYYLIYKNSKNRFASP